MGVGLRLKELRMEKGISGNALARMAGISQGSISEFEADHKSPTMRTLTMICVALDVSLYDFFAGAENRLTDKHGELHRLIGKLTTKQKDALIHVIKAIKEKRGRPAFKTKD